MSHSSPEPVSGETPVAVITGASSGIGRAFAQRLAQEGFDVILVARSEQALLALAEDLTRMHGITALPFTADLSAAADITSVAALIEALPRIDRLINSAGSAPEGNLARSDMAELSRMIDLNITALTSLTRSAVIRMRQAGSGDIVNIASGASYQPTPYLAAYGASKAYVRMFSEAVYEENRSHGVRVLAVSPGDTDTPMNPGAAKGKRQPEQVVDTAWRALTSRSPSVIDGRNNRFIAALASRVIPTRAGLRIAEKMFRHKA